MVSGCADGRVVGGTLKSTLGDFFFSLKLVEQRRQRCIVPADLLSDQTISCSTGTISGTVCAISLESRKRVFFALLTKLFLRFLFDHA